MFSRPRPRLGFLEAIDRGAFWVERTAGRGVGPLQLYSLQRTFIHDVWDTYDEDGRRRFRRAIYSVPKKWGKTTLGGLSGVYHLLFDDTEAYREVYSIAGDRDQSAISLKIGQRIIEQSPTLAPLVAKKRIYLLGNETVFIDDQDCEHRWKALSSDSPTAHGLNPSLVLVDEGWQLRDYDLLEAVSLGPQRRHPIQLWTTYAGLKQSMVEGNPLFDIYRDALADTDPRMFCVWRSGLSAYDELPPGFIREGYLDEQRRLLPPNRFQRLHLNEWGAADASFLTTEEIGRATDAELGAPERTAEAHVLTCDYGRSKDHTALLVARPNPHGGTLVSNAVAIKGTRTNPVPLEVVEDSILDWVQRYRVQRIVVDPFQMLGSAERLAKRLGWPVIDAAGGEASPWRQAIVTQPIGPAYLNRLTMSMLGAFRSGMVRIPGVLTELLDQLGAVVAKETYYGVRVDSGVGVGVRGHDDLVMTLGMALLEVERRRGPRPVTTGFAHVPRLV